MSLFQHREFDQHESVHYFNDPISGLRAVIAIHSTVLGPAAGGCRRWAYVSDDAALTDVLRLSRGMTYKNAIAGLPFGGGKAVILANGEKSPALFSAFGRAVDSLQGQYITAEDVGVSVADMQTVGEQTRYVSGLPQRGATAGGDPSPWTALGVLLGMQAAARARLGSESLNGLRVAVQGVGNVGLHLCRLLHGAGARLFVADVSRQNLRKLQAECPATEVAPTDILFSDVDILAPCALGNILNSESIPRIRASIIAGAANNQLSTDDDGRRLADRNILYAPDYVINAGGIISVAREYLGHSSASEVRREVERIPRRLEEIFASARESAKPTNRVADELARGIVEKARMNKSVTRLIA